MYDSHTHEYTDLWYGSMFQYNYRPAPSIRLLIHVHTYLFGRRPAVDDEDEEDEQVVEDDEDEMDE